MDPPNAQHRRPLLTPPRPTLLRRARRWPGPPGELASVERRGLRRGRMFLRISRNLQEALRQEPFPEPFLCALPLLHCSVRILAVICSAFVPHIYTKAFEEKQEEVPLVAMDCEAAQQVG